jgi:RimJ/RimL family protein N-acetyltransferase
MTALATQRLSLRPWRDDDVEPFTALCNDPDVMAYYPAFQTRDQCGAWIERQQDHFARHGFGLWALELQAQPGFIGYTGLQHVPFEAAFTPAVELGWRLSRACWGHGYASEAARAAITFAFETLQLRELVAFVIPANTRSTAVCMRQQRHALYRLRRTT